MDYYTAVRAFIIAADTLSLSKAALQLEVKTSTISRYISQLEADMGIALFNRSTRGLVLTEGGRVFLEHATTALKALDDARRITSSLNVRPRGLLRVTVPPAFGRQHIVRHLPTFLERYQDIELDIEFQNETVNLIDNGIDLAIRLGVLPESQLKARKLAPHYRIACASPDYLRLAGTPERPSDLNEHKILRLSLGADTNWHFVKRGAQAGSDTSERVMTFQGRLRVDDVDSLRELAIAGLWRARNSPRYCLNGMCMAQKVKVRFGQSIHRKRMSLPRCAPLSIFMPTCSAQTIIGPSCAMALSLEPAGVDVEPGWSVQ